MSTVVEKITRRPKISIDIEGSVHATIRRALRKSVCSLTEATKIRHSIFVCGVNAPCVCRTKGDNSFGFGAFCWHRRTDKQVDIWIACQPPDGVTLDDWAAAIPEIFAHELAHYEQFRDGLPMQERGIAARVKRLLRDGRIA